MRLASVLRLRAALLGVGVLYVRCRDNEVCTGVQVLGVGYKYILGNSLVWSCAWVMLIANCVLEPLKFIGYHITMVEYLCTFCCVLTGSLVAFASDGHIPIFIPHEICTNATYARRSL